MNETTHRPKRHWLVVAASAFGTLALVPMVTLVLARIFRFEDTQTIVLAQTALPYLLLPAYLIAVFALFCRRRVLAAVSLLVVTCHLLWVVIPEWRPATALPDEAKNAPHFTLLSKNIRYDNPRPAEIARSIEQEDADVLFLQEADEGPVEAIRSTGVLDRYPFQQWVHGSNPEGIAIFSKYELHDPRTFLDTGFPSIRATIDVGGKEVVLWNFHTYSPPVDAGDMREWETALHSAQRHLHDETGSVVAAGDFNATYQHRPYRDILTNGWKDAHISLGRGYARTWPASDGFVGRRGGAFRIDHVLTHGNLRATSIHETPGYGSDHRGVSATLSIW